VLRLPPPQYAYGSSPQPMMPMSYQAPVAALPPTPPSPSSAVPYLLPMGPGQQPVMGYIVPYEQVGLGFRVQPKTLKP
jgi:hypothetical protein